MKITTDADADTGRIDIPDVMGARVTVERVSRGQEQVLQFRIATIRAEISSRGMRAKNGSVWFGVSNGSTIVRDVRVAWSLVQGATPNSVIRAIMRGLFERSAECKRLQCGKLFRTSRANKRYCSDRCRDTAKKARHRQRLNAAAAT